jgi:peptidoglycan/LPS O-acetylase OafA/YrhL
MIKVDCRCTTSGGEEISPWPPAGPAGPGIPFPLPAELAGREQVTDSSSQARTAQRFYRPELDAIRFLAFSLVFIHHLLGVETPLSKAVLETSALGMCLFFFLSSYLITELLQREKQSSGRVHLQAFYVRRALRIWPLYFAFIALGVVIGKIQPSMALSNGFVMSFLFMAGNWYIGQFGMPNSPVSILWSISLEEQFYLAWPVLQRFLTRKRMCVVCLILLPLGSYVVWTLTGSRANPGTKIWTNTLVQSQFFAMGALLSLLMNSRLPRFAIAYRILAVLAGLGLWTLATLGLGLNRAGTSAFNMVAGYMLVAAGCTLIVFGSLGMPPKYLPKPIVYLGKISYGLYVFHVLCQFIAVRTFNGLESHNAFLRSHHMAMRFGKDIFALGLTIAIAMASYHLFEARFLRFKERFTFVRSRGV